MSGKGDKQRPTNLDKFSEGYDRIWGKKLFEDATKEEQLQAGQDVLDAEKWKVYTTIRPMIVGTCGNCKHWKNSSFAGQYCSNPAMRNMTGERDDFCPPADFGCRLWEGK